jgi:hypothetical protein
MNTAGACPHNGGPLVGGLVRDGVVTCPWHWYSYDLATGRCRTAAGYELRRYPVVHQGGQAYAALPPPTPAPAWSQILRAHARGEHRTPNTEAPMISRHRAGQGEGLAAWEGGGLSMSSERPSIRVLLDEHYPGWLAEGLVADDVDAVALTAHRAALWLADPA